MVGLAFSVTDRTMDGTLVLEVSQRSNAALVVRTRTLVVEGHRTITLEVGHCNSGLVNRELGVIDTKSVTVGVWVGE